MIEIDDNLAWQDPFENVYISPEVELLCDESYSLFNEQRKIQQATKQGMEIVRNDSKTLTFDLDSEEALKIFKDRYRILAKKGFSPSCEITKSKSGNYHAKVSIGEIHTITESLAIAIQACLGSDWKREILGILRVLNKQETQVSMLFRPTPLEVVEKL